MNQPTIEPTSRSRLEKVFDSNILTFASSLLVISTVMNPLIQELGFWLGLAVTIAIIATLTIVLSLPLIPAKKRRVAMDADKGIFECAHREKGSALKGRWAQGYAKAEPGRLLFQAKTGMTGPATGPIEVYSALTSLAEPTKAPWAVFPRGKIITLNTDKGVIELATTPGSLVLLRERCLGEVA
ncbi:hypothetical protein [Arthrobacter sp. ISL-65]|uniref:hypothetical protein n=1 Tax=Arthrobacter sp. ISL-65 TaxID=2819112 RepID=UPI001BECEA59|nr:hypothetical protein [Arthrobacter sp. ISL-65]MBT2550852.1 hypothetical protein [Arthrobacter sp. ISL-65]